MIFPGDPSPPHAARAPAPEGTLPRRSLALRLPFAGTSRFSCVTSALSIAARNFRTSRMSPGRGRLRLVGISCLPLVPQCSIASLFARARLSLWALMHDQDSKPTQSVGRRARSFSSMLGFPQPRADPLCTHIATRVRDRALSSTSRPDACSTRRRWLATGTDRHRKIRSAIHTARKDASDREVRRCAGCMSCAHHCVGLDGLPRQRG
jgi:hypothetical protein